jgi:diaminopimelate decarboxylase
MTAHSLDDIWSLAGDLRARFEHGARPDAKSLSLVDETVAIRRCALYRNAFKGTAVSYPAAFLGFDALTDGFGAIE